MYSDTNHDSRIVYKKVMAVFADGHMEKAPIERWVGAMADTRYRDIFRKSPEIRRDFFDALLKRAVIANPEIVAFELQIYARDFEKDPDHEQLIESRRYSLD